MTAGLTPNSRVIALDRSQPAGPPGSGFPPLAPYLSQHIDANRIGGGKRVLAGSADLAQRIEAQYGVPAQILIAIWGHETNYGSVKGDRTMEDIQKRRADRWNFLFIAGMWFQDLFNYDFRRTEQCIIPYATQEGEISFCAYNTGIGWRNIIEKMHMTATLTKWYEEHGRHEIFAGGKKVGVVTCGMYSRLTNRSMAIARMAVDVAKQGTKLEVKGKNVQCSAIAHTITFDDPEKKKRTAL